MFEKIRRAFGRRLLDRYKVRKQRAAVLTKEHALAVSRAMLNDAKYCFLITHGGDGWCSARLVEPIVDEDDAFTLWFGTSPSLRKVREIEADPRVTIAVGSDRKHANVVLYGTARIERDEVVRRRRWIGTWRLFFPRGPTSEDYVVIRFDAERIELMSFARNVVPEPFGLRPVVLHKGQDGWVITGGVTAAAGPGGDDNPVAADL